MNVSALLIIFGAILLFVPQTSWLGIATLCIGGVTYALYRKEPMYIAQGPPKYMRYMQAPSRPGVEVTRKNQLSEYNKQVRDEPSAGPRIEKGMFKLPLPVDDEIAQLADITYNVPTKAKGFTQEKDKGGNPWLPGF